MAIEHSIKFVASPSLWTTGRGVPATVSTDKAHVLAVELMPSKKIKAATAGLKPVNVSFDGRCYIFGNWHRTRGARRSPRPRGWPRSVADQLFRSATA